MKLSVPCTFAPGLIGKLSRYPEVAEVYGRSEREAIGGGRTSYTLRHASNRALAATAAECKNHGIAFNYLLNASSLFGMEQTRSGRRFIKKTLDTLSGLHIPWLTVSLPHLLRIIKSEYPHFKVKVGVFARIDSPEKAKRWEAMGADALCISAISCNRDFAALRQIRTAVACDLQLIANAACIPSCIYEHTHMDLLSSSSRKNSPYGGFCYDYCFLQCSSLRLREPERYINSIWIRPEDLHLYEQLGYTWFKLVERSCPTDLLLRRVEAYSGRSFDGNLWELVAPVAFTPDKRSTPLPIKIRTLFAMAKPWLASIRFMAAYSDYARLALQQDFSRDRSPVYIDNRQLDGFLEGIIEKGCTPSRCERCGYCGKWAERSVSVNPEYREQLLRRASSIDRGLLS